GVAATSVGGSGLDAPFRFKGGSYPGTGGTCTSSLPPTNNCTIVVTFNPTDSGLSTDTIQIDYNDGTGTQASTRDVRGTGVSAALLEISDAPLFDFGNVAISATKSHTFTVTNNGEVTAT